ncbi:hypothetical protein VTI74DRAFT_6956 [Chaetomium olivicolor]
MHDLGALRSGAYKDAGLTQLKLACPLDSFPEEILELGDTLEQLDLSGTGLSSLPSNLASALPKLKTALLDDCNFKVFPKELASCPKLEKVAFRGNGMQEVPEDALPLTLRCLILTNNDLTYLPRSIGLCGQLHQLVVTGNQLREVPAELKQCKNLALLRLGSNNLKSLPSWAFALPELSRISFASNPCAAPVSNGVAAPRSIASIPYSQLELPRELGEGSDESEQISITFTPAVWTQSADFAEEVSVRLFRGARPSDAGHPADELAAWMAAGSHESLITVLGRIQGHPAEETSDSKDASCSFHGGLVAQDLQDYVPLSSLSSSSEPDGPLGMQTALMMLTSLAKGLDHLHERGIAHGNVCPEHILASTGMQHALLGDLSAASIYNHSAVAGESEFAIKKVEVLAFGRLMEYVLGLVRRCEREQEGGEVERKLKELSARCLDPVVLERPDFDDVVGELEGLLGWRGMMRIPDVVPS